VAASSLVDGGCRGDRAEDRWGVIRDDVTGQIKGIGAYCRRRGIGEITTRFENPIEIDPNSILFGDEYIVRATFASVTDALANAKDRTWSRKGRRRVRRRTGQGKHDVRLGLRRWERGVTDGALPIVMQMTGCTSPS
jgi:hypothetical protein